MNRMMAVVVALLALAVLPAAAGAVEIHAGWVRADLGLDAQGDGFTAGVGGTWPLGTGSFDVTASGEYVVKRGSQPLMVGNPDLGLVRSDAEVTLRCLQPAAFVGFNVPLGAVRPRLYAGASISIKLDESWQRTPGATNRDYGYEDVDAAVHLGVQLRTGGRFFLDARYNHGLLEQVVDRDGDAAATKEFDPLTGAQVPEDGDTVSSYQLGVGVVF